MKSTYLPPVIASLLPFKSIVPLGLAVTNLMMCSAANAPAIAAELSNRSIILAQTTTVREVPMLGTLINTVLQDAYQRTNLPPATLKVSQAKAMTFGNPCIFNFGEICTKEYNPVEGWDVVLQGNNQTLNYRVDKTGSKIAINPKNIAAISLPVALQNQILTAAANRAGLPPTNIKITQATAKTFSNPCVFNFGEVCTFDYRPIEGWDVLVAVRGQTWTYHIDKTGSQIALDPKVGDTNAQLPTQVQTAVMQDAMKWSRSQTVKITEAKQQTWGNSCSFGFGRICPMLYQPVEGWEVKVSTGKMDWTYRANQTGTQLVMDRRPTLPTQVADAIAQDLFQRNGRAARPEALRFLDVKQQPNRSCVLLGGCRDETNWLAIVSNGQQQWGYQSNERGSRVLPLSVSQVLQANAQAESDR
ncbi:hypothetical protein JOY44_20890 [Phormidium sp. CLA17]|uniref:hypothetical protein n=1 Tax=Leptolyngbya sp. Cla-17 TaxID=2803751 RepID=UPI0018D643C5|nr:hypothetical protein [Leptolyngbya sp. Cla-17]MBM0744047.1 hypothetical protein [Leptolyngbya sp. Cla-17]